MYDATEGVASAFANERVTAPSVRSGLESPRRIAPAGHVAGASAAFRHAPIAIVGGGTGMIGDQRQIAGARAAVARQIDVNLAAIASSSSDSCSLMPAPTPRIVNNADWLGTIDLLSFLTREALHRELHAAEESVKRRLESEEGISFTEFSYLLLQAYDFLQLFDRYGCTLHMGGSDQWGNITAGIDLIRKLRAKQAHGLVVPLVMTASGVKFGKTESGTIWLDPERTPPFNFYQFWLHTDDRDVIPYLKFFTWLERETIETMERAHAAAPEKRDAQRLLAREVTTLVHGEEEAAKAERGARSLFAGDLEAMAVSEL